RIEAKLGKDFWKQKMVPKRTMEESWKLYQPTLDAQRKQPGHENDIFVSRQKGNEDINALSQWMSGVRKDARKLAAGGKPRNNLTQSLLDEMEMKLGKRFWEQTKQLRTSDESWALYEKALDAKRTQPGHEKDIFLAQQKGEDENNTLVNWMRNIRS